MQIDKSKEFDRDFKPLLKRYRTLETDMNNLVDALESSPSPESKSNLIILKHEGNRLYGLKAYLYCASLKTDRKIRVIYTYDVDGQRIKLVEIYVKSGKDKHDKKRLERYFGEFLNEIRERETGG